MDILKIRIDLAKEYVSQLIELNESISKWLEKYVDNQGKLYDVYYWAVKKDMEVFEDKETEVRYSYNNKSIIVENETISFECKEEEFKNIVSGVVDIMMELLPLGTVIDLKKEHFSEYFPVDEIDNLRFVIESRYSYVDKSNLFFPYGGIVYPVGRMVEQSVMYFTPPLIERVVYKGYTDEVEEAYEIEMKKELVIEKRKKSIAFGSEKEKVDFQKEIKRRGGKR
jgi:Uncharacterized protein conserved in bacteria